MFPEEVHPLSTPIAAARAVLLALAGAVSARAEVPETLRVDYVHSGTDREEHFALSNVVLEGPWPGNPDRPIDESGLGKYVVEVHAAADRRLLYSRGFASIFGEWRTTAEAKETARAFSETVRFPRPADKVSVSIHERQADRSLKKLWSVTVDPKDPLLDRAPFRGKAWAVVENGPPARKVDLLLLGDGYAATEMDKWHADARRMAELLFSFSPFKERRSDFNVWAVDTPAEESGVSRPSDDVWRRTPLRASYDAFGSERYVLALDNPRLRDVAAAAPYDFMEIVVNERKYGGGGIHGLYATVAADSAWAPYLFVHEFGHHFAGLADEYYTSDVAYEKVPERPEPWEPNATADPKAAKWADLLTSGVPLPTPWPKAEYEKLQQEIQARRRKIRADRRPEAEMDELFREESRRSHPLLAGSAHASAVGAFEGALYEAQGYYRPQANCMMFSRGNEQPFCAVCRRAIEGVIDAYTRPASAAAR
jgi:hypothetical protein